MEADHGRILGAAEDTRDLRVRQALPSREEKHFAISLVEAPDCSQHDLCISTCDRERVDRRRVLRECTEACRKAAASHVAASLVRDDSPRNSEEPQKDFLAVGGLANAPPEHEECLRDDVVCVRGICAPPKSERLERSVMRSVEIAEAQLVALAVVHGGLKRARAPASWGAGAGRALTHAIDIGNAAAVVTGCRSKTRGCPSRRA